MAKHIQETATDSSGYGFVLDEDNLTSNSATKVPTQQSVKAYVDGIPVYTPSVIPFDLSASSEEVVTTLAERQAVDFDYWADGGIGIKWNGSGLVGYAANSTNPATWNVGFGADFLDSAIDDAFAIQDIIDPNTNYAAGGPILSLDGMDDIMFYHGEENNGGYIYYSHIGIAAFRSGVLEDCGRILEPNISKAAATGFNVEMGGAPYVVRGDYVYVFFADILTTGTTYILQSVARCSIDDLKTAINSGNNVPVFKKYHNGMWVEDGLGGEATEIWDSPSDFIRWSDVIYLEKYDQYMGIYSFNDSGWNFGVRFSKDLINWTNEQVLLSTSDTSETIYPTLSAPLVGSSAFNQRTVPGDVVDLYYTSSVLGNTGGFRWDDAYMAKRTITLSQSNYVTLSTAQEITGQKTFTATGSGTTPSLITHGARVLPNSGVGTSAGVFLDNDDGQLWEVYNNSAGSWGLYNKTAEEGVIDVQPNTNPGLIFASAAGVTSSAPWSFSGTVQMEQGTDGLVSMTSANNKGALLVFDNAADTAPTIALVNNGIEFSNGTTTDVKINRTAANTIALDSGDKLQQNTAPTVGDDLVNKTYHDLYRDLTLLADSGGSAITNSTTEGSLLSSAITITAGTLRDGDTIDIMVNGGRNNNSGANQTVTGRFKINGSAVTSPNHIQATNGFPPQFRHIFTVTRVSATTVIWAVCFELTTALNTTILNRQYLTSSSPLTVSNMDSNNLVLDITHQHSTATATSSTTPTYCLARLLRG